MVSLDALGNKIDPLIILETLKNNGTYDEAAGKNYLFETRSERADHFKCRVICQDSARKNISRAPSPSRRRTIDNAVAQTDSADMLLDAAGAEDIRHPSGQDDNKGLRSSAI